MKIFISYSWDSKSHNDWVLNLANKLINPGGMDVILDQYDLSVSEDMTYFMEKGLTANKILIILTANYLKKAEKQSGGVGFEYSMIRQELYEKQDSKKFIPILRSGKKEESIPKYLSTRIYHPMIDDNNFDSNFIELLRIIYDEPKIKKPKKSKKPDFDNLTEITLKEKIENFNIRTDKDTEIRRILTTESGLKIAQNEIKNIFENLELKFDEFKDSKLNFGFNRQVDKFFEIHSTNFYVSYYWYQMYGDSVKGSYLLIKIGRGIYYQDQLNFEKYIDDIILEYKLTFDLNIDKQVLWITENNIKFTSEDLIIFPYEQIINNEIELQAKNLK